MAQSLLVAQELQWMLSLLVLTCRWKWSLTLSFLDAPGSREEGRNNRIWCWTWTWGEQQAGEGKKSRLAGEGMKEEAGQDEEASKQEGMAWGQSSPLWRKAAAQLTHASLLNNCSFRVIIIIQMMMQPVEDSTLCLFSSHLIVAEAVWVGPCG